MTDKGCGGKPDRSDAATHVAFGVSTVEAGRVHTCGWLLLLLVALPAQAAELKLATWNLGWLTQRPAGDPALPDNVRRKSEADLALLAGYAARLDADVVALQGVDDEAVARLVFPASRYTLMLAGDAVTQHTGFAVRLGLAATRNPDLDQLDPYPGAKFHLRAGTDITLSIGPRRLRLLSVHLKSGCRDMRLDGPAKPDRPACAALMRQADVLRGWLLARAAESAEAPVVIPIVMMGDFGRVMEGADEFVSRIGGQARLTRATAGHASPCWGNGSFVDDLLIVGPAAGWVQPGSLRVMVYRETGAEWRGRLSGHCPVSIRMTLPD